VAVGSSGSTAAIIWAQGPVIPSSLSVRTGVARWCHWTGGQSSLSRQLNVWSTSLPRKLTWELAPPLPLRYYVVEWSHPITLKSTQLLTCNCQLMLTCLSVWRQWASSMCSDPEWDRCMQLWCGWCRVLGLPQGDVAGASEHYEHVTGDVRVAECFEFQVGSTAESVVETSTTLGYGYPRHTVALPTMPLSFNLQELVLDPLPAAQRRLQDWMPRCFESPQNPSRRGK